jgi:glucose-1-phosphate thymidylyltransferase
MSSKNQKQNGHYDLVGVIPAAGTASRLGPLPCSKELLPFGFHRGDKKNPSRPKVVSHYLLRKMRRANVSKVYMILRKGKWDIPAYFGDGKMLDMHIAYLMMDLPFGVPYTIDQAYPFVKDSIVLFGFPDIPFQPKDAYVQLLNKQRDTQADLVLGLFLADHPAKMDMVELDNKGFVRGIQIKPSKTHLQYTWIIAVWTSAFTHHMHEYISSRPEIESQDGSEHKPVKGQELYVGDVIQAALKTDIRVESVFFPKGKYVDIGTPEDLMAAMQVKGNN